MRNQPYLCSLFDRLNGEAGNKKVRKRLIWHILCRGGKTGPTRRAIPFNSPFLAGSTKVLSSTRYFKNGKVSCPIRIRYRYASDTFNMRIREVSDNYFKFLNNVSLPYRIRNFKKILVSLYRYCVTYLNFIAHSQLIP
jgi:hypothetical protein